MARAAQLESTMNPGARNPNSSATGLFQFTKGTARDYNLDDRTDPVASSDAAARLWRDNLAKLERKLNRTITQPELYLAHQQGAGGAGKLLANPDARAVDVLGRKQVMNNLPPSMQKVGSKMSARDFSNMWMKKFGQGGPGMTPQTGQQPPMDMMRAMFGGQQPQRPNAAPTPPSTIPGGGMPPAPQQNPSGGLAMSAAKAALGPLGGLLGGGGGGQDQGTAQAEAQNAQMAQQAAQRRAQWAQQQPGLSSLLRMR